MSGNSQAGDEPRYRVVGVIHLPPLPGAARGPSARQMGTILDFARRDAATWTAAGADALVVENFHDVPFSKGAAAAQTIAAMTLAVAAVIAESGLPVGVNVLRNDVEGAASNPRTTRARKDSSPLRPHRFCRQSR